ncbi:ABC transporter ATP-binding protein [Paenibacillus sp. LHD-38]|uniref:ABC transporter ATP-binding protein n=1 Tax=Paenibacillus sp. LHD-38 TaxID=3072143 RepID=UPI00280D6FBE|nr:ABC transporter ATP-binding protein [Paenibacillus sp. LHD-38]MDQ8735599.1 ABC transporter ATP-binding protein [Paenibacillus sp. LHD-38]
MKLIFRYLKPFALSLAACILFLFIQVSSDLGLPKLMSDMVDTGIQAGGIEGGAPTAISDDGMELLKTFAGEQDATVLDAGYALIHAGTDEDTSERYPISATKDIYRLVGDPIKGVGDAYTRAVYALVLSLQNMPEGESANAETAKERTANLELEPLYTMSPLFKERHSASELDAYISSAAEDESMAGSQVAVMFTRLFYEELGVDLKQLQRESIIGTGLKMIGVALLGGFSAIVVGWFSSKIGTSVAMRMRRDIFEKVGRFSSAEYDSFSTASLITRNTNDVQQIQQLIMMGLRLMLLAPIMGIGGVILAIRSSVSMSWIIAVAVISIVGMILVLFSLSVPKFKTLQTLIDKLNLVSRESLSGMMVIRSFGNERYEETRFEQANDNLRQTNRFVQRTMAFMLPAMTLVMNLVMLLIIWVGAKSIAESELQIGNMMAFMQYAMQIIVSFLFLSMMFMMVPRAVASAERIQEVLGTELSVRDPEEPRTLTYNEGITLAFKGVSFSYRDAEKPVLEDVSFTAKPGETTAFIGTTGSGKSTLVSLVPRFHDVTAGQITMNGIEIRSISQNELRESIGYVPQKGMLFSGDIASNVRYGKESADISEVGEALEVAQAKGFVEKLEQGIATPIAQGGTNVSGGQRQRLAIARALIKKAPIYIFDDSFSALDLNTDAALRRALKSFTANATVLVVAQRVSTIKNAEQIIVLDKGHIIGIGTHQELLESCAGYREIAESQLSKEELA